MQFRPLHDRVVVRRLDAEEKTAGGIIIPDTAKEKPGQGEVIAVGPGGRDESGKLIPIDVKAGDTVLFRRHAPCRGALSAARVEPGAVRRAPVRQSSRGMTTSSTSSSLFCFPTLVLADSCLVGKANSLV